MHNFVGKRISNDEFFRLEPRNVFHRQLEPVDLPCDLHSQSHSWSNCRYKNSFESRSFVYLLPYYRTANRKCQPSFEIRKIRS